MLNFSNVISGAASVQLFGHRTDHLALISKVRQRAVVEKIDVDTAFKLHMRERVVGQCLMTGISLSAIGVAMFGVSQGWSDYIVAPLALTPFALMLLLNKLHQRST